ncbi:MAG: DUF512 domain-containing protein [Eubacteriales bacterium]|nr:DUF512 domain-containing protein [Eubacteriales bacterium]
MKNNGHLIRAVDPGSIAEELELEPGDKLLKINGNEVEDIFDYEYYMNSESMVMLVEKADGDLWELEIENDYEDLGITFENGLMSDYKSCSNKCIFCFIDQMPPGMRETLYFKDDDSRLSFLQGNYITLTNMKDHDIQRIIDFKLAPINISVHTTNPELRCMMLHNRFAGEALKKIDTLYEHRIPMNGQIVLCKGVNDGAELDRTIRDLTRYIPCMESVSVVPVGLSKFRDGLHPLEPFEKADAEAALAIIEGWQKKIYEEHGIHFIHASDEFYLTAERELPEEERYDGFPQLENGVGMLRLLDSEVDEALAKLEHEWERADGDVKEVSESGNNAAGESESGNNAADIPAEEISIATGLLAYPYLKKQIEKITARFPQKKVHLYAIRNDFFGEMITVAGLITGQDLQKQLSGQQLGTRLLLPVCMFRSGEEVFLDDVTRAEVQTALQVPVNIVKSSGQDLLDAILYPAADEETVVYRGYEL